MILDMNNEEGPSRGKSGGRTWGASRESPKGITLAWSRNRKKDKVPAGCELKEI